MPSTSKKSRVTKRAKCNAEGIAKQGELEKDFAAQQPELYWTVSSSARMPVGSTANCPTMAATLTTSTHLAGDSVYLFRVRVIAAVIPFHASEGRCHIYTKFHFTSHSVRLLEPKLVGHLCIVVLRRKCREAETETMRIPKFMDHILWVI